MVEEASLNQRWAEIQELGQKDLEKALSAQEWYVRNAALVAIKSAPEPVVRKWSEKLLFDKALVVRTQAIKNLIDLESDKSAEPIFKALNDPLNFRGTYSLWIRPYLAQALAAHPPKNWKNVYQKMLVDPDDKVQAWAILGLEKKSGLRLGSKTDTLETKRQKWLNFFEIRRL